MALRCWLFSCILLAAIVHRFEAVWLEPMRNWPPEERWQQKTPEGWWSFDSSNSARHERLTRGGYIDMGERASVELKKVLGI
ncbi:hypothetical protein AAVH_12232 [Aphelenchoides avenae]|nr:hypothetical protein AAVH_12232 [Aphelenchus avenae]